MAENNPTGYDISQILNIIDTSLNEFVFMDNLHIFIQGVCTLVVIYHFSSVVVQNLLRAGDGFSFDVLRKPFFYLVMIWLFPTILSFIVDLTKGLAETVTDQQQVAYNLNINNFEQIDDAIEKADQYQKDQENINSTSNVGVFDSIDYQISSLDERIMTWFLKSVYEIATFFDSFLYVCFYFFAKLWFKLTMIGGGIAFCVSMLSGGWTVFINWAKNVLSVVLWIPVSALVMTLINSIMIKILLYFTPKYIAPMSSLNAGVNESQNVISGILILIALTIIFFWFKVLMLSKVPTIISSWVSGGSSASGGFAAAFVPMSFTKNTISAAAGTVSKGASSMSGGIKK